MNKEVQNLDRLGTDILSSLKVKHATMPEQVFKSHYLPYFNGSEEVHQDSVILKQWEVHAGGVYAPVDITDTDGKVILTTPGIFGNVDTEAGVNYNDVVSTYEQKNERLPGEKERYADEVLHTLDKDITFKVSGWEDVFAHYGEREKEEDDEFGY